MHIRKQTKAISTLLAILLILLSAIIGALISYMWTMAPFYLEPENAIDLIVTDANFPVNHATYFDVTVMNPSHSISGTNITSIYVTAEGFNSTTARGTEPSLPIFIDKGTSKTINCSLEWGEMAGETITVHVLTMNKTEAARAVETQRVKLEVAPTFDASESVEYFNVTITNANSAINLTMTRISLDYNPVQNLSVTLPTAVNVNDTLRVKCLANWEGHIKPIVRVETQEGYAAETRTDANATISLQVTQVTFNETNPNEIDITLFNSPDSAIAVDITRFTLMLGNITDAITGNLSAPALPQIVDKNQNVTFTCAWNWTDGSYRSADVTITAYTKQGFTPPSRIVRTPSIVAGRIDEVGFDLDDTGIFSVNITNLPYSLQTINVTRIELNGNPANITATLVPAGEKSTISCVFNWSNFTGETVSIVAHIVYDSNESLLNYSLRLPYLKITNASFSNFSPETPYITVTVRNSEFSKINATITQMRIDTNNTTLLTVNALAYEVTVGSQIEIVCSWNWASYVGQDVTITVQTADGFETSATFKVG